MQNKLFDLYQAWRADVRERPFADCLIDMLGYLALVEGL